MEPFEKIIYDIPHTNNTKRTAARRHTSDVTVMLKWRNHVYVTYQNIHELLKPFT